MLMVALVAAIPMRAVTAAEAVEVESDSQKKRIAIHSSIPQPAQGWT